MVHARVMNHARLTTLVELSQRLRVPYEWLRAEAERGGIPCLRAGRSILVSHEAVEAALLERAKHTPAEEKS